MPGWPLGGGLLDGEALGETGGDDDGGGLLGGVVFWNCEKNFQISPDVHVRASLGEPDPSTGLGVWSPSNAAHWTGYPDRHPGRSW